MMIDNNHDKKILPNVDSPLVRFLERIERSPKVKEALLKAMAAVKAKQTK